MSSRLVPDHGIIRIYSKYENGREHYYKFYYSEASLGVAQKGNTWYLDRSYFWLDRKDAKKEIKFKFKDDLELIKTTKKLVLFKYNNKPGSLVLYVSTGSTIQTQNTPYSFSLNYNYFYALSNGDKSNFNLFGISNGKIIKMIDESIDVKMVYRSENSIVYEDANRQGKLIAVCLKFPFKQDYETDNYKINIKRITYEQYLNFETQAKSNDLFEPEY